jgi:hypothetical protein
MLSEMQFSEYDKFCEQFMELFIYSYNNGGYFDACGDMNIDDANWDASKELRHEFEAWIQEVAPGKQVDCGFMNGSLSIYEQVLHRSRNKDVIN